MEPRGIGKRIRFYRMQRGITQMRLADRVGVSYQQIQKYEKEKTKITLQRLFLIAKALDVPAQAFLKDPSASPLPEKTRMRAHDESPAPEEGREERRLLQLFARIKSDKVKRTVLRLLESIVEQQLEE